MMESEDLYRGEPGDDEPSWVENERDSFRTYRDKDGDGKLNHEEVKKMDSFKIFNLSVFEYVIYSLTLIFVSPTR